MIPRYTASRALIIGIDAYSKASPLSYAVSDAKAIASLLSTKLNFPEDNVALLFDKDATRDAIMKAYLSFASPELHVNEDDRILIFFAGHGHTIQGRRGDIGFLVPHDGDTGDFSTLIRWDDWTKNTEIIPAKHLLFIMDACYGGLAIQRTPAPGSMRFLQNMLTRYARQVITAGKGDEVVADSGGPLPGHSVFTGHLLQGLNGEANSGDGVLTASGLMAYVYDRVSRDHNSRQTPHYGFIDGDGDFIFYAPGLESEVKETGKEEKDLLVTVPVIAPTSSFPELSHVVASTKEFLADNRYKIQLDDLISQQVREVISLTGSDHFPADRPIPLTKEEVQRRLSQYEVAIKYLRETSICIAHWGTLDHTATLQKLFKRLADQLSRTGGLQVWLDFRTYPIVALAYGAGISAVASRNYVNLHDILLCPVNGANLGSGTTELVRQVGLGIQALEQLLRKLQGYDRKYVPHSEYFYKLLQPTLDDLLFLGTDYERCFDRFEILLCLVHYDLRIKDNAFGWGPIGRFGWKYKSPLTTDSHWSSLLSEAKQMGSQWEVLNAGMFGGKWERFEKAAIDTEESLNKLPWW